MSDRREHEFVSFDGGVKCAGAKLDVLEESDLDKNKEMLDSLEAMIPRGAGVSYAAGSFGQNITSIEMSRRSSVHSFDVAQGKVVVDAGVSIGGLLTYLVRNGFYISIIPGYPTITIGGCMAADVHGKNQIKDGTFSDLVESFRLHHVDKGVIEVSREINPEIFQLTLGGFGLTGTILTATLRVPSLPNRYLDVVTEPIADINELPVVGLDLSKRADSVISWHDFQQAGGGFGRGYLQWGKFADPTDEDRDELSAMKERSLAFPVLIEPQAQSLLTLTAATRGLGLPQLFSHVSTGLMNTAYTHIQSSACGPPVRMPAERCFFPSKTLRDLYFHFFGSVGFFEHQALMPSSNFPVYIEKIQWWLKRHDLPITIASSKMFQGKQDLLRFKGEGICFALDFPRCANAWRFLEFLDQLTLEVGAIPNIIKDSRLPSKVVKAAFPEYETFRKRLKEYDPKRRYQSELSRRLEL